MEAKRLSTLIGELTELLGRFGDGYVEVFPETLRKDGSVPVAIWSEDDEQYYLEVEVQD